MNNICIRSIYLTSPVNCTYIFICKIKIRLLCFFTWSGLFRNDVVEKMYVLNVLRKIQLLTRNENNLKFLFLFLFQFRHPQIISLKRFIIIQMKYRFNYFYKFIRYITMRIYYILYYCVRIFSL